MRRSAVYATMVSLFVGALGFSTPSRAETGQVAVVFTKGGFIVASAAARASSCSGAKNIRSPYPA